MRYSEFLKKMFPGFVRPFVIAEAGVNHEGNMDLAKRLIDEAKEGGADAIKFQTYKAETIASRNSPYYWDITKEPTRSQFELFKKYDRFGEKEFVELKSHCDRVGIEFMSTPFDVHSADYLNNLMDVFKISSSDITNKPFIEYICAFKKPIMLSVGASNADEIEDALGWIRHFGNDVALLHCVLNYPTLDENARLLNIRTLARRYPDLVIGYSDHTMPSDMHNLEVATLLGAAVLEKHFTFDKTLPGNDHYHAMDKEDLKVFVQRMDRLEKVLGDGKLEFQSSEIKSRENARRSLVLAKSVKKGEVIERDDLTWKRPASGVSPKYIDSVIGKHATRDLQEDDVLNDSMFE